MESWTRLVLRHRWVVLGAWIVVLTASIAASSGLGDLLTNRFTLPGTDTQRAETILEDHFGQTSTGSFTLVVKSEGRARQLVPEVRAAAARAAKELPTARLVAVTPISPDVVTAQLVSELEPADAKGHTDDMRRAVGTISGAETFVTGQAAIEHDLDPVFGEDLAKGELIAVPIALLILIFTFGTLSFLLPFLFALVTIPTTLGIVWIFANFMELTTYLQNLVTLIGLGIAIDYSLLIVYRFREELRQQSSKEDAIVKTMATAGRAVVFSGTAVAIGLALLLFMPLPFMRGFGIGGLIIPSVSIAAAVTFLPVLLWGMSGRMSILRLAGIVVLPAGAVAAVLIAVTRLVRRGRPVLPQTSGLRRALFNYDIDHVRLLSRSFLERRADHERGFWATLARSIMRRPLPFALGTTALLVACALPILSLQLGPGSNEGIPRDLEAVRGLDTISAAAGEGALAPTNIVVDTGRADGVDVPGVQTSIRELQARLRRDPQVANVAFTRTPQHVDRSGRYANIEVTGRAEYGKPESLDFVDRLRDEIVPTAGFPPDVKVFAGGGPPSGRDFIDLTYSWFPWLVAAVLVATYFLLLRAFRSLLLPLKAIILNLLSIGAAYGLLVAVFKWGWGEPFGLIAYDQIEAWIPVMLFAMLFGLSMDYEVFLVSRMREEWDNGAANADAVALGLAKTGRLVTAAGLIMFAAFMGFVAGSIVGLQQFGFGLAAAILIDVSIVRALLVPSVMELFGRWNWWLPAGVARVARVPPSPLGEHRPALRPAGR